MGASLQVLRAMRDPRYRFSDDVRSTTRAIALRTTHAGEVLESPEQLDAWIARTEDLQERLTSAGYRSAFTADDLFPLFQSYVAKASVARSAAAPRPAARSWRWLWIGAIVAAVIVAIVVVGTRVAS